MNWPTSIAVKARAALLVVAVAGIAASTGPAGTGTTRHERDKPIRTAREAIDQALGLLGAPAELRAQAVAALVKIEQDNTPFLSDRIAGQELWRVTLRNWRPLGSAPGDGEGSFASTFDVLLDPGTADLLTIKSRWPAGVPQIAPEPPARSAEAQMRRAGRERYHGVPDGNPPLSFLQALEAVRRHGVGDPARARQIVAQYVLRSGMGGDPRPVWVVTLRGFTPLAASRPGVPEDARNHIRNIIDADTGEWLLATTSPQPVSYVPFLYGPPPAVTFALSSTAAGGELEPGQPIDWTITATASAGNNEGLAMAGVDLVQSPDNPQPIEIPPGLRPAAMEDFDRPRGISNPGPDGSGSGYGGTSVGPQGARNLRQIGGAQNTFGVTMGSIGTDIDVDLGVAQGPDGQVIAAGAFPAPLQPGVYSLSLENAMANVLVDVSEPGVPEYDYAPVAPATIVVSSNNITFSVSGVVCIGDCGDHDGSVGIVDLLRLLADWGGPSPCDADGGGVGITDFLALLGNWGSCPDCGGCVGDANGSCTVDYADFQILIDEDVWGSSDPDADFNGDGVVGVQDLLLLLAHWGPCGGLPLGPPGGPPAGGGASDLDGDGVVDVLDVRLLAGRWGPCGMPCPPACLADLDGDCMVNQLDVAALIEDWTDGPVGGVPGD
ncbi:MAG: dockerin type I domain-containing protein [Planctomycetota bacterium]|jgi:hypothetical protein